MAEITIVKPHDEGKSALEVTVNGEKWSLIRGETADVPDYIAEEVRRSLAQRESLSLSDRDEREGEPESGGSGGGGGESSNIETATIVITVTDGTPAITSGEFPDWFTEENSSYIYGKASCNDYKLEDDDTTYEMQAGMMYVFRDGNSETAQFSGTIRANKNGGLRIISITESEIYVESWDDSDDIESATINIELIYIPNGDE